MGLSNLLLRCWRQSCQCLGDPWLLSHESADPRAAIDKWNNKGGKIWKYPYQKINLLLLLDHFFMGVLPKSCHGGSLAGRVSCPLTLENYLRCLFLCKYVWPWERESRVCSMALYVDVNVALNSTSLPLCCFHSLTSPSPACCAGPLSLCQWLVSNRLSSGRRWCTLHSTEKPNWSIETLRSCSESESLTRSTRNSQTSK